MDLFYIFTNFAQCRLLNLGHHFLCFFLILFIRFHDSRKIDILYLAMTVVQLGINNGRFDFRRIVNNLFDSWHTLVKVVFQRLF